MATQGIRSDPAVMMGKPVVEDTRITVESILEELGAGQTIEDLLEAHPRLTREGVLAAVRFGAEVLRADITYKLEAIEVLCRRYGVVRLFVFGSALRDDFREGESDVDLLVEFGPMDPFALVDAYFGLLNALRGLLGTRVDLVMSDAIKNRYIVAEVDRTKQILYAA